MQISDLEKIGLNVNESKVYLALLKKGKATASELGKYLGTHRSIVYDNLEKLIEKGIVSFITDGSKKRFVAENPETLINFLENQKVKLDDSISFTKSIIPEMNKILSASESTQDASVFRGIKGIKKILYEVIKSKEYWCIGLTNESVQMLGETFWINYALKRRKNKCKENILLNPDFIDVFDIKDDAISQYRRLPNEFKQVTEIMIFGNKAALIVYGNNPVGLMLHDSQIAKMFKNQFDFLWKIAKK